MEARIGQLEEELEEEQSNAELLAERQRKNVLQVPINTHYTVLNQFIEMEIEHVTSLFLVGRDAHRPAVWREDPGSEERERT